jgi:DNA-binding GntR family transcriptional regulator
MSFSAPKTLATSLFDELRREIQSGGFPPGERINEVLLANRLDVSRTPLREALNRLAASNIVLSTPRVGFLVPQLSVTEFRDLYGMRAILDCAALQLSGIAEPKVLNRLEDLTSRMAEERSAARRIDLDDRFHLLLIERCPNRLLLAMIADLMGRTRRYELAYLAEQAVVEIATDEHMEILAALRDRDLPTAIEALRTNLTSGLEPLSSWLEQKFPPQTQD